MQGMTWKEKEDRAKLQEARDEPVGGECPCSEFQGMVILFAIDFCWLGGLIWFSSIAEEFAWAQLFYFF